jgi:hypothetical protein
MEGAVPFAYFRVLPWHFYRESEEYHEKPVTIVGNPTKIQTRYFPNTNLEC